MSVNLEVKGTLAKLLASEDLIVEHKSVETASFNVQTRVLTLPRWEKATNSVIDLLVAHEVGHALFTPNEDWRDKVKCPHMFVNVCEDVRIESLMKRKFAGLPKTFYRGYQELHDEDFFSVADDDIDTLQVADRINLHFKVGGFLNIEFNDEEREVMNVISSAETFDDALEAAELLYALHQKQKEEQEQKETPESNQSEDGDEGQSESDESGERGEEQVKDNDSDETAESDETSDMEGDGDGDDETEQEKEKPENNKGGQSASEFNESDTVKTMEALEDKLGDLTNTGSFDDPDYIDYPTWRKDIVVDCNEVHGYLEKKWKNQYDTISTNYDERSADNWYERNISCYKSKFNEFKREIQSEVNYLVKEFECKKSATAYARATTSRTGVLDCTKLHTYKYNEDLFKKVTNLPEGKNHGLVFVLDWSGSMCNILEDTVKQLLSLVMFCDKVNIPFKVYAFTNEWRWEDDEDEDYYYNRRSTDKYSEGGVFHIPNQFHMLTMLSSGTSRKVLFKHMANLYALSCLFTHEMGSNVPSNLMLSGTPLNEALVSLRYILPEFKRQQNVEKAHVIVLTDGEAGGSVYTRVSKLNGEEFIGPRRLSWGYSGNYNVFLRNRNTGTTRAIKHPTTTIIEDLRDEFPESSFTGFRISDRSGGSWVRQACDYDAKLLDTWKREKCIALVNQGYNKYYVISASKLQDDVDFDVDEGATKARIKSAFAKSLKNKKTNKRILADFIGEIA